MRNAKCGIPSGEVGNGALKELDETSYWLELLTEGQIVPEVKLTDLQKETSELIAIFVLSINTSRRNNQK